MKKDIKATVYRVEKYGFDCPICGAYGEADDNECVYCNVCNKVFEVKKDDD